MYPEEREQVRQLRLFMMWAFCFVLLLKLFYVSAFEIEGPSMLPTYHDGERIIAEKVSYRMHEPEYKDVVIVRVTNKEGRANAINIIKRIVGKPGDVIEVRGGFLYRNGQKVKESYIKEKMKQDILPYVIPEDEYFVMGDNRNNSTDSRDYGSFKKKSIIGKVWFQWG